MGARSADTPHQSPRHLASALGSVDAADRAAQQAGKPPTHPAPLCSHVVTASSKVGALLQIWVSVLLDNAGTFSPEVNLDSKSFPSNLLQYIACMHTIVSYCMLKYIYWSPLVPGGPRSI